MARREDELRQVQNSIARAGGHAWVYPADLTDAQSLADCAEAILADHSQVDVVVNNAAHSILRPITDALDRLHKSNVYIPLFLCLEQSIGKGVSSVLMN